MSNFKKEAKQNLFSFIIVHVSQCCEKMMSDCKTAGNNLYNHEDKISNRLVERYLDLNYLGLRFERETLEHYDAGADAYKGRSDIQVMSSDWIKNRNAYYTIECKRLDGEANLNRKYVLEGISRFIPSPEPKYPSYYGRSIMLGYIVKSINVEENAMIIDKLQRELLVGVTIGEMRFLFDDGKGYSHYQCLYQVNGILNVELAHLFYDFSDVMDEKS